MRKLFIIMFGSLMIINCEVEKIIEVEKKYNWKAHNVFEYNDVVQMNSYASFDRLHFLGYQCFTTIEVDTLNNQDNSFGGNINRSILQDVQPSDRKLPICTDYFISYIDRMGLLTFIPTMNPLVHGASISVKLKVLDSLYGYFDFIHFSKGECIEINERNKSLIPYKIFNDSTIELRLILIDIKAELDQYSQYQLDTVSTEIIKIPGKYQNDVISIESIGDNFFLTTDSKVYRIDNIGNIMEVLETRLYNIIESSGKLFGIGRNNVFKSLDNGLTWSEEYTIHHNYSSSSYVKVNNNIVGYRYGQLWEILITETELIAKELDNDGLDGVSITSISEFDNKMYLSSLSGVYYKSINDFFNYKTDME